MSRQEASEALWAACVVLAVALAGLLMRPHLAATNIAMIYLLGVVAIAMRCRRRVALWASFASVGAFDFLCVPPYLTFRVTHYEDVLLFAGMLAVALVISTQTARIREQTADAMNLVKRTEALYQLSHLLASHSRVFDAAREAAQVGAELFPGQLVIFLPEDGRITFRHRTSDHLPVPTADEPVAQWVYEQGKRAGNRTGVQPGASALYLPLRGVTGVVGVMAVIPKTAFTPEQQSFLDAFADHTALALERTRARNAAEEARVEAQAEEMRSSLLSAVSHDLRTPLASITGAASTLRTQGDRLPVETRTELLESIAEEAERLGRLVSNLIDMTRLQSGVELRRDLCPIEEIVGVALQRLEHQLGDRQITTVLVADLPPVPVDEVLMGQVVLNLLENAARYTPAGTPIEISAEVEQQMVQLEIRDRGPGFKPGDERKIFEKFYRGKTEGARGAGLGLAICRAIVAAHKGTIEAYNRTGGGAVFRIRLPLGEAS